MIDLDRINAALATLSKCTAGIIGEVHTKVPGAEHIKRMIPLPSVMLMDEVTDQTVVKWCHDRITKDLRGRVGLLRRIEVRMLHETIKLAQHDATETRIRENVDYEVDVTFPALVYRLFILPAESSHSQQPITAYGAQGDGPTIPDRWVMATDHAEEALRDNVPGVGSITAQWRCQCPMCEHHRTAAAIINAEGQG